EDEKSSPAAVRRDLVTVLSQRLQGEHTLDQAREITADVGKQFQPLGVKRAFVGPPNEDGESAIIVEMSPGEEVALLAPGGVIKQRPVVRLNVEFTLAPAPDEERGAVAGTVSESIKPDRRDKREYEYLEAFREIQPKTRTGSGKPVGGIIFPEEGGKIQL